MAGGTLCSTEKGFTVRERHPPIRAYVSGSVTEKDVERIQINPRCLISGRSLKQRHETTHYKRAPLGVGFECLAHSLQKGTPSMTSTKYIGMDVHKESISIAVLNFTGKVVMECVIETKASTILQFIDGLHGDLQVTFEEGTWAAWLYDLLKPHVTEVVVCNPRKIALLKDGSKSDRIDARKLAEQLYMNKRQPVYHGEHGLRTLKE